MLALISMQAASVLWCICNHAADKLVAAQAGVIYGMELVSSCLVLVGNLIAERGELEASLRLAVLASEIMVWSAFVPIALTVYDNLLVPPIMIFLASEVGTVETIYLMITGLILTPISIMQTLFGMGADNSTMESSMLDSGVSMDLVANDMAATADEGGEELL